MDMNITHYPVGVPKGQVAHGFRGNWNALYADQEVKQDLKYLGRESARTPAQITIKYSVK